MRPAEQVERLLVDATAVTRRGGSAASFGDRGVVDLGGTFGARLGLGANQGVGRCAVACATDPSPAVYQGLHVDLDRPGRPRARSACRPCPAPSPSGCALCPRAAAPRRWPTPGWRSHAGSARRPSPRVTAVSATRAGPPDRSATSHVPRCRSAPRPISGRHSRSRSAQYLISPAKPAQPASRHPYSARNSGPERPHGWPMTTPVCRAWAPV
jgi:hypothetical protein